MKIKLSRLYLIITLLFVVYVLFFDSNSYLILAELDKEIEKLEQKKRELRQQIEVDKSKLQNLNYFDEIERLSREEYYFLKEDEEVYLIHYDTL